MSINLLADHTSETLKKKMKKKKKFSNFAAIPISNNAQCGNFHSTLFAPWSPQKFLKVDL